MPEVVCNTSPLQYLHQLGLLHILPSLVRTIVVPPAVVTELNEGRSRGIDLPRLESLDWIHVRTPGGLPALPLIHDLGAGETEVLMLALESPGSIVLIDERLARQTAMSLRIPFKGTLGMLLEAKKAGHVARVAPLLDQLQSLRFRLASGTRKAVLELAGESVSRP